MVIFTLLILHWYLSLFFQTFFLHRYAAHKMFHMSPAWEKTFFLSSFIAQGSSYLSPYAYGVLHRMHHAFADTANDPHSPKYDKNLFAMMWRTKVLFSDIFHGRIKIEGRFTEGVPEWFWFDKFANNWTTRIVWMVGYTALYIFLAEEWWMYLFLPIHFAMGPIHGVVINWFAHKYGYINFKVDDTSKNLLPFDFLMLGESYHNNHHKNSQKINFGSKWFEFDPVYSIIRLFDKLRIVQLGA